MKRKKLLLILVVAHILILQGCCRKGDNACYKYWYGLDPHPTEPGRYINVWDKLYDPNLRAPEDPGAWDWLFGIEKKKPAQEENLQKIQEKP